MRHQVNGIWRGEGKRRAMSWTAFARPVGVIVSALFLFGVLVSPVQANTKTVVAFGDSLVAGYGLHEKAAFPAQLEAALRARGHDVRVVNAGVSGDTTAGGLARFDWAIPEDADAVLLELGANDALRGISPNVTRANLDKILARLSQRKLPVLVTGMRAPSNWGKAYGDTFNPIFRKLAAKYGAIYDPFFLEGVALEADLNQSDGMHPNAKGVSRIVRRLLPKVEKLLARIK